MRRGDSALRLLSSFQRGWRSVGKLRLERTIIAANNRRKPKRDAAAGADASRRPVMSVSRSSAGAPAET
jgi:hypothetical protein